MLSQFQNQARLGSCITVDFPYKNVAEWFNGRSNSAYRKRQILIWDPSPYPNRANFGQLWKVIWTKKIYLDCQRFDIDGLFKVQHRPSFSLRTYVHCTQEILGMRGNLDEYFQNVYGFGFLQFIIPRIILILTLHESLKGSPDWLMFC